MDEVKGYELEPCPLCGSMAAMWMNPAAVWSPAFTVKCQDYHCGCSVQGRTENEAADKWNRRVEAQL
jgi:hypothetical protein